MRIELKWLLFWYVRGFSEIYPCCRWLTKLTSSKHSKSNINKTVSAVSSLCTQRSYQQILLNTVCLNNKCYF